MRAALLAAQAPGGAPRYGRGGGRGTALSGGVRCEWNVQSRIKSIELKSRSGGWPPGAARRDGTGAVPRGVAAYRARAGDSQSRGSRFQRRGGAGRAVLSQAV